MSASVEEPAEGTRDPRASTVGNPAFDDLEEGGSGAQQAKTTMDGLAGVATAAGSMAAAQRAADKWSARTERAARPAHTLPALIGQLMTLRTGLQNHRAELAQALDMIKEGTQPGASPEAKAEAEMVEALLGDIVEETELVTLAHEKAAADKYEPMQLSFRAQKRGQRMQLENKLIEIGYETVMEQGTLIMDGIMRSNPAYSKMASNGGMDLRLAADRMGLQTLRK